MRRTVVGIPASYDSEQNLETNTTRKYLEYLSNSGAGTAMTTAGTSHYNLLSIQEIHELNSEVVNSFSGNKIIGVPALSLRKAIDFVKDSRSYTDKKTNIMLLYPERFYSEKEIVKYCTDIRHYTDNKIYIHGKAMRKASGGVWDYDYRTLNSLYGAGVLQGIKEEHSNLQSSYNFVSNLNKDIDVIVAGGSMRRFEYLESAGANSFLSGVGNFFPQIEQSYLDGNKNIPLKLEKKMFDVFIPIGWHKSLRIGLDIAGFTCYYNRDPWPTATEKEVEQIKNVLEIINEKK